MQKWLERLEERFKRDIQAIRESYRETEIEFREWRFREYRRIEKEFQEELERETFEHSESGADDRPDRDDRLRDRERMGAVQSEDDLPKPAQESVGEPSEGNEGEGDSTENIGYDDEFDDIYEGIARMHITEKRQKSKKPKRHKK